MTNIASQVQAAADREAPMIRVKLAEGATVADIRQYLNRAATPLVDGDGIPQKGTWTDADAQELITRVTAS